MAFSLVESNPGRARRGLLSPDDPAERKAGGFPGSLVMFAVAPVLALLSATLVRPGRGYLAE